MKKKNCVPEIKIVTKKLGLTIERSKSDIKRKIINSTDLMVEMCRKIIPKKYIPGQEQVITIFTDINYNPIGFLRVATGAIGEVSFDPRNIFLCGVSVRAERLIMCHTHPDDDVRPSPEDLGSTTTIHTWCKALDIYHTDEIIIGPKKHFSLDDTGLL